jgi:GTP 3',8-cyclase
MSRRHLPVIAASAPLLPSGLAPQLAPVVRAAPRMARVSLTDRCDLACVYCRPHRADGYADRRMSIADWTAMLAGLWSAGIRRIRMTGGEPLLHPALLEFVRAARGQGFEDLALTTNATQLAQLAAPLVAAGLQRLTVSLDTLCATTFRRVTRGGDLHAVLRGIEAATRSGFRELKLNVVVARGVNEFALEELVHYAWDRGITPRFLEIMPIGEGAKVMDLYVPYREIRQRLDHLLEPSPPTRDADRGPAGYVASRATPARRIGFITGTSDTFCAGCDRLRVSASGDIRPCLATGVGVVGARDVASRADIPAIVQRIHEAWAQKPDGSTFRGCTEASAASVSMRQIGG